MTAADSNDAQRGASVRVAVRADLEYLHIFRGVAELVSTAAGFDFDATDDLRLAVDEIAATLIEISEKGADVECEFTENGEYLHIELRAHDAVGQLPKSTNFRWHIVKTLADDLSWDEVPVVPAADSGAHSYKTVVRIAKRKATTTGG
ncbi:ATP-binding protein [Hoyosella sp. YIM 151337]|uniref:ATP-binding protein n=1 Tax=Hoyosella sp. YIM 151337 TaxID=2992742 RepID=UPI0022365431|nr:ATP-binding protein [Hoyosella sp. YIM 151337]MCW4355494.1 ATP-binding protein [Hoyosella sp. YIM 151337]